MKTLLFNPFKRYSEKQLLVTGILTAITGIFLAGMTNTHFDGVLDTHFGKSVSLGTAALESLINVISITLVFYIIGKIINSKTRFIDIINIALLVKIPAYFMMPLNINNWVAAKTERFMESFTHPGNFEFSTADLFFYLGLAILGIGVLTWLVILLHNGFKIATNLKSAKHIILFIVGIILAEILSKALWQQFIY